MRSGFFGAVIRLCVAAQFYVLSSADSYSGLRNTFSSSLPQLMFVDFNAVWFRSYSRAMLESDSCLFPIYLREALNDISETLSRPGLDDDQRLAISFAAHELYLMRRETVKRAA